MQSNQTPMTRAIQGAPSLPDGPGPGDAALARRVVYFLAVFALAGVVGLATTRMEPLLVGGALVAAFLVAVIVRRPYFGLLLYIVIYFTRIAEVYPQLAPLRPEMIIGAVTVASLFLQQVYTHRRLFLDASRPTLFLLFTVLAAYLSVPAAYWRFGAINTAADFIKILVLYLMVVHLVDSRAKLRGFVWLYALLIAQIAALSTYNYFRGAFLHASGIDRAVGATSASGGPNEMGATMATTIPLFLLLGFHRRLGGWRHLFLAGAGLLLVTMALTGSRSALIGFMAAMGYLWWHSRHRILLGMLGILFFLGGFSLLPDQYKGRYSTLTESEVAAANNDRIEVWIKGLKMFANRPLTGVGVGCFPTANAMDYSTGLRRSYLNSHSLYVQVPAEMGTFGLVALFGFLYVYIRLNRRMARRLTEDDDDWGLEEVVLKAIFLGSLVLLVTGVFGHSAQRRTWYIYAALTVCIWRIFEQRAALKD